MSEQSKIFSFDVGKASLGICVRENESILELDANLFETTKDSTVAGIDALRARRKAYRNRLSHKSREADLQKTWLECGYELPDMSSSKMTREFAPKGDKTLYTSCLLRIALLQNLPLEPWQIYKALWSAIQRRGYETVPWATSRQKQHTTDADKEVLLESSPPDSTEAEDEKKNQEGVKEYQQLLESYIGDTNFYYPCYLEAAIMGLWSKDVPQEFKNRIQSVNTPQVRGAGRVAPRQLVETECRELLIAAAKQLPHLAGKTEEILYGPAKQPYSSYRLKEFRRFRGTQWDWQGVLSQKVPRFDNRIIAKCQLMPQRNVCKGNDITNLEVKLLFALKNFRYTNVDGEIGQSLTADEIRAIFFSTVKTKAQKGRPAAELPLHQKATQIGGINATDLRMLLKANVSSFADTKVEAIKLKNSGRSRFCRPALRILKDILLSGQDPLSINIHSYVQATDPRQGVTELEVLGLIRRLGETWQSLHIGDDRNESLQLSGLERRRKILWTIGSVNNPVVRHRLTWFWNTLKRLENKHGIPGRVVLEFVRDSKDNSLEGQKRASDTEKIIKQNEKYNEELVKELQDCNIPLRNLTKLKLLNQQGGRCIYTGESISLAMLDTPQCQVDHIVPVARGGNDELQNKVLCLSQANQEKGDRTPYEWLFGKPQWAEFSERIEQCQKNRDPQRKLGNKKYRLLLSPNAVEQIESYNALAETAYIARLAQRIVALQFGWPQQVQGEARRIYVSNGKNTALIRRIYGLDCLLYTPEQLEQLKNDKRPIKKNRDNQRHHALDAFCISYSQDLKYKRRADGEITWYVDGLSKPELERKLQLVVPERKRQAKAESYPEETIYGLKQRSDASGKMKYCLTVMKPLYETFVKEKDPKKIEKKIWDGSIRADLSEKAKVMSQLEWDICLKQYKHPKRKSLVRRVCIIASESENPPKLDEHGRLSIGEYFDFGNSRTKGQFKRGKKHQGQILYTNQKGKVHVMPVYCFQSLDSVKAALQQSGYILYADGHMFSSGSLINVQKDFQSGRSKVYPGGIYKIRTIISDSGQIKLESLTGEEILTSANYLTTAGFVPYTQSLGALHS